MRLGFIKMNALNTKSLITYLGIIEGIVVIF